MCRQGWMQGGRQAGIPFWSRMSDPEIFWPPKKRVPFLGCSNMDAIFCSCEARSAESSRAQGRWRSGVRCPGVEVVERVSALEPGWFLNYYCLQVGS